MAKKHPRHAKDEKEPYPGLNLDDLDFTKAADIRTAFNKIKDWSGRMHDAAWYTREVLRDHVVDVHNMNWPPGGTEPPPDPPFGG